MARQTLIGKIVIVSAGEFAARLSDALSNAGNATNLVKESSRVHSAMFDEIPCCTILDAHMEGFDAYKALAEKHSEEMLKKIPAFLISDSREPIDISRIPKECRVDFLNPMYIGVNDAAALIQKKIGR